MPSCNSASSSLNTSMIKAKVYSTAISPLPFTLFTINPEQTCQGIRCSYIMAITIVGVVMCKKPFHLPEHRAIRAELKAITDVVSIPHSLVKPHCHDTSQPNGTSWFCVYFRGTNDVSYFDASWVDDHLNRSGYEHVFYYEIYPGDSGEFLLSLFSMKVHPTKPQSN